MSTTEETFWMVWNPQGHAPTAKHPSRERATAEAERLARQCRGQTFVVLEAVCARVVDEMKKINFEREMPF